MKIILVGAGKVGYSVADMLSDEGHDITVIDRDPETITHLSNDLDVICVEGNATNPETLMEAGAAEADLLMAATEQDEVNMICGIAARKLGTKHIIARIRDPEYLNQTEFLREVLGLSVIINPEYECAKEISRMLRFPSAVRVDAFSKGSVEIIEHRIQEKSKLDGMQLKKLSRELGAKVLVCVVERGGDALIPNGDFVLRAGDRLSISGASRELRRFFVAIGQYRRPVKDVMVMGGGRISVYLTRLLLDSGIAVTVIDRDRERCDQLCDLIPNAHIIVSDDEYNIRMMREDRADLAIIDDPLYLFDAEEFEMEEIGYMGMVLVDNGPAFIRYKYGAQRVAFMFLDSEDREYTIDSETFSLPELLGSNKSFFIDEFMLTRKNLRLKSAVDPKILRHAITAIYRKESRNIAKIMKAVSTRMR